MIMKPNETFEAWTKPTKAAFDFWVSFWPVAPAFGVEWRFAEAMPRFTPRILETGLDIDAAETPANTPSRAQVAPKPRAVREHAEPAVEIVEAVEAAMAPVEAVIEAAVETVEAMADAMSDAAEAPKADADVAADAASLPAARPVALLDTAPAETDDLKLIKGIGPGLEKQLNALGVYRFDQIAAFSDADLAWVDANLTAFKGRCFRDDWIGQARAHLA